MTLIDEINTRTKNKYYIPCMVPFIVDSLQELNIPIYMSLIENEGFYAVPSYSKGYSGNISANLYYSKKLGYKKISSILGIEQKEFFWNTYKEGIEELKELLKVKKIVIVGVTAYHLPFLSDYHNKNYIKNYSERMFGISNHYIAVSDIKEDSIYVHNTTPVEIHDWMGLKDFKLAWEGDSSINELKTIPNINSLNKFTTVNIHLAKKITYDEIIKISFKLLYSVVLENLNGNCISTDEKEYFYGKLANENIILEIKECIETKNSKKLRQINVCLLEQKISRLFFYDLFQDICLFSSKYIDLLEEINENIKKLEKIIFKLGVEVMRSTTNWCIVRDVEQKIAIIFDDEKRYLFKILNLLESSGISEKIAKIY